jgi:ABC-type maltose transport system permease subunit
LSNNLFMALILTYLLLCIIALNISAFTKHKIYGRFINLRVILILALTAAAFAAIRNIPVFPFTRLAP